jgi:hypothetical protein
MGGWRVLSGVAFAATLLCATPAAAATTVEPIARLSLEGGYDTNALNDGNSADEVLRLTPEAGVRVRDRTFSLVGTYGGEWLRYQQLLPGGTWNQRGELALDARLDRRTRVNADFRAWETFDPAQLAQAGVFRVGAQRALLVNGSGRLEWRADPVDSAALTYFERTVVFQDGTGGAMHAPAVELMRRIDERLSLGVGYAFGVFQSYLPGPDERATSHGFRARARWRVERHVAIEAWAGPAVWLPSGSAAIVPEGSVAAFVATRGLDVRVSAGHGLGLGATAQPGLVDSAELGLEHRIGRRWFVRGDGGLWRSGLVPTMAGAVTGYAAAGEGGVILSGGLRLSLRGAHYGRADSGDPIFRRTTVGVRLAWELQPR